MLWHYFLIHVTWCLICFDLIFLIMVSLKTNVLIYWSCNNNIHFLVMIFMWNLFESHNYYYYDDMLVYFLSHLFCENLTNPDFILLEEKNNVSTVKLESTNRQYNLIVILTQGTFCNSQIGRKMVNLWVFIRIWLVFPKLGKCCQNQSWV